MPTVVTSSFRRAALRSALALLCCTGASLPLPTSLAAQGPTSGADSPAPARKAPRPAAPRPAAPRTSAPRAAAPRPATSSRTTAPRRATPAPRAPLRYATPYGSAALTSDIGAMLGSRVRSGRWGVLIVSLTRGDTLYSHDPDAALQPASNMKLFTAALALERFGADHQFSTDVLREGLVTPDGTLHGNLILRGDGDPGLSRRFYPRGTPPMDSLAQLVALAGIKRVTGSVVADASAFDTQRIPEGWQSRYLQSGYAARVSALSLNDNLVWVVVRPGRTGQAAIVSLDPATEIPLSSSVQTVAGAGTRVFARNTASGAVEVRGSIGASAGEQRYLLVAEDPTAFTAGAFRRALEARGIKVDGATRFAPTPKNAEQVTSLPSPPLARLVSLMNRESINIFAELLFRGAAREARPDAVGSVESANRLLQTFMTERAGAAPGAVFAADGSGLSVLDRATPRSLVQLLAHAHDAPWGDAFHASLPVAGESELLRHRMKSTPAQGNLHAKTGTTNDVISLGGYVTSRNGELLAFALIYNGTDRWNARETIDAVGATLAGFGR